MNCYRKSATSHQISSSRLCVLPDPTPFSIVTSHHCFKLDTFKKSIRRTSWPSLTSPKANATFCQDRPGDPKIQRTGSSLQRWAQKIKTENTLDIKKVIIFVKCNVIFVKRLITAIRFLLINSPLK